MSEAADRYRHQLHTAYQAQLDALVPHVRERWAGFAALLLLFVLRIVYAQGWYIVCYSLFIYLLNLFLAFLTPKFDPSLEQELRAEEVEEGLGEEPEFRPFMRRLPEFKFWHRASVATVVLLVAAFVPLTDIPVFWPILVVYFVVLFALTMRRQIQHMVKYRYLPWDLGKKHYAKA